MNDILKTLITVTATVLPLSASAPALAAGSEASVGKDTPVSPTAAHSAGPDLPRVAFTIKPLGIFAKTAALDLGIRLGEHAAVGLSGRYTRVDERGVQGNTLGGGLGLQYYWSEAFRGLYLYPRVLWDHARTEKNGESVEGEVITSGMTGGYQFRWSPVTIRLGSGIGYVYTSLANTSTGQRATSGDVAALFDIDLGVVF